MAKTVVEKGGLAKYGCRIAKFPRRNLPLPGHDHGGVRRRHLHRGCRTWIQTGGVRRENPAGAYQRLEICVACRKAGFASRDYLRELILGREILLKTISTRSP
tara:strand:- start:546 stop:854 length:309 start_codon:yes stop_codon:yes gene_type:complete